MNACNTFLDPSSPELSEGEVSRLSAWVTQHGAPPDEHPNFYPSLANSHKTVFVPLEHLSHWHDASYFSSYLNALYPGHPPFLPSNLELTQEQLKQILEPLSRYGAYLLTVRDRHRAITALPKTPFSHYYFGGVSLSFNPTPNGAHIRPIEALIDALYASNLTSSSAPTSNSPRILDTLLSITEYQEAAEAAAQKLKSSLAKRLFRGSCNNELRFCFDAVQARLSTGPMPSRFELLQGIPYLDWLYGAPLSFALPGRSYNPDWPEPGDLQSLLRFTLDHVDTGISPGVAAIDWLRGYPLPFLCLLERSGVFSEYHASLWNLPQSGALCHISASTSPDPVRYSFIMAPLVNMLLKMDETRNSKYAALLDAFLFGMMYGCPRAQRSAQDQSDIALQGPWLLELDVHFLFHTLRSVCVATPHNLHGVRRTVQFVALPFEFLPLLRSSSNGTFTQWSQCYYHVIRTAINAVTLYELRSGRLSHPVYSLIIQCLTRPEDDCILTHAALLGVPPVTLPATTPYSSLLIRGLLVTFSPRSQASVLCGSLSGILFLAFFHLLGEVSGLCLDSGSLHHQILIHMSQGSKLSHLPSSRLFCALVKATRDVFREHLGRELESVIITFVPDNVAPISTPSHEDHTHFDVRLANLMYNQALYTYRHRLNSNDLRSPVLSTTIQEKLLDILSTDFPLFLLRRALCVFSGRRPCSGECCAKLGAPKLEIFTQAVQPLVQAFLPDVSPYVLDDKEGSVQTRRALYFISHKEHLIVSMPICSCEGLSGTFQWEEDAQICDRLDQQWYWLFRHASRRLDAQYANILSRNLVYRVLHAALKADGEQEPGYLSTLRSSPEGRMARMYDELSAEMKQSLAKLVELRSGEVHDPFSCGLLPIPLGCTFHAALSNNIAHIFLDRVLTCLSGDLRAYLSHLDADSAIGTHLILSLRQGPAMVEAYVSELRDLISTNGGSHLARLLRTYQDLSAERQRLSAIELLTLAMEHNRLMGQRPEGMRCVYDALHAYITNTIDAQALRTMVFQEFYLADWVGILKDLGKVVCTMYAEVDPSYGTTSALGLLHSFTDVTLAGIVFASGSIPYTSFWEEYVTLATACPAIHVLLCVCLVSDLLKGSPDRILETALIRMEPRPLSADTLFRALESRTHAPLMATLILCCCGFPYDAVTGLIKPEIAARQAASMFTSHHFTAGPPSSETSGGVHICGNPMEIASETNLLRRRVLSVGCRGCVASTFGYGFMAPAEGQVERNETSSLTEFLQVMGLLWLNAPTSDKGLDLADELF